MFTKMVRPSHDIIIDCTKSLSLNYAVCLQHKLLYRIDCFSPVNITWKLFLIICTTIWLVRIIESFSSRYGSNSFLVLHIEPTASYSVWNTNASPLYPNSTAGNCFLHALQLLSVVLLTGEYINSTFSYGSTTLG